MNIENTVQQTSMMATVQRVIIDDSTMPPVDGDVEMTLQNSTFDDGNSDGPDYIGEEIINTNTRKRPRDDSRGEHIETSDTFKPKKGKLGKRKMESGNVFIKREQVDHPNGKFRTRAVSGFVEPTSTKGRPSAPEPGVGPRIGVKWKEVGSVTTRDTGIVDAQKGHLMALELGGPDIKENIVGQWAQWQSNGVWREAEKAVLAQALDAKENGNKIFYDLVVRYKEYEDVSKGSAKGVFFPVGFTMTTTLCDGNGDEIGKPQIMFDEDQSQDLTDFMMAQRSMDLAEEESVSSDGFASSDESDSEESDNGDNL